MPEIVIGRDEEDTKRFGTEGTLNIGKHLVGTGEEAHLTTPVLLDAIRPHVITVTGKRGEGKCVLPDTPVFMADNTVMRIEDIFHSVITKQSKKMKEELVKCHKKIEVLSAAHDLSIVPKEISHVYRKLVDEKLFMVKTRSGAEITATKEHPLLVLTETKNNGMSQLLWIKAAHISAGNEVAIMENNKILFDNVAEIQEIDYSGYVYDITVPETHNFIAGINGIVCHNSYSLGVIAEEIFKLPERVKKNLCCVIVDTQGIFWTMKSPDERELVLLNAWGLKPRSFPIEVFVPEGQEELFSQTGVDFDAVFSFLPSELAAEDWINVFGLSPNEPLGILLMKTFSRLSGEYHLEDVISQIAKQQFAETEKLALQNRFEAARTWGIFGESRMPSLLEPGKISVIDVSLTPQNVRALLLALMSRHLLSERIKARRQEELAEIELTSTKRVPMPWILIDEAHNFLPNDATTAASDVLSRLIKEGRQPGVTLVLATQRPEKLHQDALAQTDIILSHRLTSKADIDALRSIMQTYMLFDISKYINELPKLKGVAIILDDNSERIYKVRVRPRQSWHAGESPVAV